MRAVDFLSDFVGIDVEGSSYTEALKCLTEWFSIGVDFLLHPDVDIEETFKDQTSIFYWEKEAVDFREYFKVYLDKSVLTAREFLTAHCDYAEDNLDHGLECLRSWLVDADNVYLETDIAPYIDDYFDGDLNEATENFKMTYSS